MLHNDVIGMVDAIFIVSFLLVLYAINLIHKNLRLLENEQQSLRKDISLVSEEIELIADQFKDKQAIHPLTVPK